MANYEEPSLLDLQEIAYTNSGVLCALVGLFMHVGVYVFMFVFVEGYTVTS